MKEFFLLLLPIGLLLFLFVSLLVSEMGCSVEQMIQNVSDLGVLRVYG